MKRLNNHVHIALRERLDELTTQTPLTVIAIMNVDDPNHQAANRAAGALQVDG